MMTWGKNELVQAILLSIAVVLALRFIQYIWRLRRAFAFTWHLAKDQGLPIMIPIRGRNLSSFDERLRKSKQHTIGLWTTSPMLVTAEPDIIEQLLKSPNCCEKSRHLYKLLHLITDGGIVAAPMKKWTQNRRLVASGFGHQGLLSHFPSYNKAKNLAIEQCNILVDNPSTSLSKVLGRVVLQTTLETTMGKIGDDEQNQVVETFLNSICLLTDLHITHAILSVFNLHGLLKFYRKFGKAMEFITNTTNQFAKNRLKDMEIEQITHQNASQTTDSENYEGSIKDSAHGQNSLQIFLKRAIENYQYGKWPWESVISESKTLILAGFETTAKTIFNALLFLAMHPEYQIRLYEEIVEVFPTKDFVVGYEHMDQLPYLHRVLQEVLRVAPIIPGTGRHVRRDTHLTNGLVLPQGTQIMISIFHLHRRHDIWGPNAHKFNPDHFLPENLADKHPYAYMPFLKGPRNCVGGRYAQFVMKTMLCGLIRNFYFTTDCTYEHLRFASDITLILLNKPLIRVQRR